MGSASISGWVGSLSLNIMAPFGSFGPLTEERRIRGRSGCRRGGGCLRAGGIPEYIALWGLKFFRFRSIRASSESPRACQILRVSV